MPDFHSLVLGKAYRVIPGVAYNQVLSEITVQDESGTASPLVYEAVLPEGGTWEAFRDRVYPPFVRYMKWKEYDPADPQGVIVALFFKENCYLLDAPDFLAVLSEMEGLNPSALHFRILQWLLP